VVDDEIALLAGPVVAALAAAAAFALPAFFAAAFALFVVAVVSVLVAVLAALVAVPVLVALPILVFALGPTFFFRFGFGLYFRCVGRLGGLFGDVLFGAVCIVFRFGFVLRTRSAAALAFGRGCFRGFRGFFGIGFRFGFLDLIGRLLELGDRLFRLVGGLGFERRFGTGFLFKFERVLFGRVRLVRGILFGFSERGGGGGFDEFVELAGDFLQGFFFGRPFAAR